MLIQEGEKEGCTESPRVTFAQRGSGGDSTLSGERRGTGASSEEPEEEGRLRVRSVHTATKVCSASGGCAGNGCSRDERSSP